MGPGLVSFMFAVGAGTWIFTKFQRSSGNNTRQSLIASGVAAVLIFIVFYYIFKRITG